MELATELKTERKGLVIGLPMYLATSDVVPSSYLLFPSIYPAGNKKADTNFGGSWILRCI